MTDLRRLKNKSGGNWTTTGSDGCTTYPPKFFESQVTLNVTFGGRQNLNPLKLDGGHQLIKSGITRPSQNLPRDIWRKILRTVESWPGNMYLCWCSCYFQDQWVNHRRRRGQQWFVDDGQHDGNNTMGLLDLQRTTNTTIKQSWIHELARLKLNSIFFRHLYGTVPGFFLFLSTSWIEVLCWFYMRIIFFG